MKHGRENFYSPCMHRKLFKGSRQTTLLKGQRRFNHCKHLWALLSLKHCATLVPLTDCATLVPLTLCNRHRVRTFSLCNSDRKLYNRNVWLYLYHKHSNYLFLQKTRVRKENQFNIRSNCCNNHIKLNKFLIYFKNKIRYIYIYVSIFLN